MTIFTRDGLPGRFAVSERLHMVHMAAAAMIRALRNRRAALQIADLSDDHLSDIGLRRDDVHAALNSDWHEDPTYRMAVAARRCRMRIG